MSLDELAELMAEPPGGHNHGRVRTAGGWRSLEPDYSQELPYIVHDPEYRAIEKYRHGTRSRYVHGQCRCDKCRKANRDYFTRRRGGYAS